jgi:hypothetical protein
MRKLLTPTETAGIVGFFPPQIRDVRFVLLRTRAICFLGGAPI